MFKYNHSYRGKLYNTLFSNCDHFMLKGSIWKIYYDFMNTIQHFYKITYEKKFEKLEIIEILGIS